MNRTLLNLLKMAAGLGLLYFLYTRLEDPAELRRQISESNKALLLAGTVCYASAVALSGLKWGVLLRAAGMKVGRSRLLAYQWVAEFFNNFLPAQVGGDVMRGYSLASDTHRSADAAASVLIDRFIGLLVFMFAAALASVMMLLYGRPDGTAFSSEQLILIRIIALGSSAVTLLLLGTLLAVLSRRLKVVVERVLVRLPLSQYIVPIWHKLADAFSVYRHQYQALMLTALGSVLIVILTSVNIWLISWAIQPNSISLLEVLAINPIIVFVSLAIPLSPGGLGVRQGAFAATYLLVGAGGELGFAVGLMQQFLAYLVSLPGAIIWVRGSGKRTVSQPRPSVTDPVSMRQGDKRGRVDILALFDWQAAEDKRSMPTDYLTGHS